MDHNTFVNSVGLGAQKIADKPAATSERHGWWYPPRLSGEGRAAIFDSGNYEIADLGIFPVVLKPGAVSSRLECSR
jgi:hypothetical protein